MIERQTIVTWYRPDEKLPPTEWDVILCTVSGRGRNVTYDHILDFIGYDEETGWFPYDDEKYTDFEVHAWCDLLPYGISGRNER